MSLINDALRRANQAKKNQPPVPSGDAPMQPANPLPSPSKFPIFGPLLLIVLLAAVLSLASWFFWKGWQAKSKPGTTNVQTPVVAETKTAPVVITPNTPEATEKKAVAVPSAAVEKTLAAPTKEPAIVEAEPVAETESSTNAAATIVASTPPAVPELKLQGIFYRITNPTAMINGKTVSVGEKVSGARVLKIERQEVTVERNGETTVLTLP